MDNMGGISRLYLVDANYFSALGADSGFIYDLLLDSGVEMNEIEFTEDTGRVSETEEETDNGVVFNYEVTVLVPKVSPGDSRRFSSLRDKKLLVLVRDNNDLWWLTGSPGAYFKITISSSTGTAAAERNGSTLTISASLPTGSVFINELP